MSITNFKLVPKIENNIASIWIVLPNGESQDIAWFRFPNDNQLNDNMDAINQMIPIMRKRIKRSL